MKKNIGDFITVHITKIFSILTVCGPRVPQIVGYERVEIIGKNTLNTTYLVLTSPEIAIGVLTESALENWKVDRKYLGHHVSMVFDHEI